MRYIEITLGKRIGIKQYMKGVQTAKANPTLVYPSGLTCWWSCTGKDIYNQYLEGLHDRINQAIKNKNL